MTREEFYKLTDILSTDVLGNFMHGGEADELIAMFEEVVEHSNILEQEEPVSEDLEEAVDGYTRKVLERTNCLIGNQPVGEEISKAVKFGAKWQKKADHQ